MASVSVVLVEADGDVHRRRELRLDQARERGRAIEQLDDRRPVRLVDDRDGERNRNRSDSRLQIAQLGGDLRRERVAAAAAQVVLEAERAARVVGRAGAADRRRADRRCARRG
jgi:hypothetical protein